MAGKLQVLVWTVCLLAIISNGECVSRQKRSIIEFAVMINCATGRNPFDYNNYGCHCGVGGTGRQVDQIDRCCYRHDRCYDALLNAGRCNEWTLRTDLYGYSKSNCHPSNPQFTCSSDTSGCKTGLCACDRTAALCFHDATYHLSYSNYDKSNC